MAIPKPWRPPKSLEKMRSGKMAYKSGKKHQDKVAEYLGMRNRWPLKGIDIIGPVFSIEAKSLGVQYPGMVERWLQDAEFRTRKARPEAATGLNLHNENEDNLDHDLIILRMKDFRWLLERLEG